MANNPKTIVAGGAGGGTVLGSHPTDHGPVIRIAGALSVDVAATGFNVAGTGGQAVFDLFALDATPAGTPSTPEPASILLLGSGVLGFAIRRFLPRSYR